MSVGGKGRIREITQDTIVIVQVRPDDSSIWGEVEVERNVQVLANI